jgi:hypothetical protein
VEHGKLSWENFGRSSFEKRNRLTFFFSPASYVHFFFFININNLKKIQQKIELNTRKLSINIIVIEINEKFSYAQMIEGTLSQFTDSLDVFRHCLDGKTNL